MPRYKIGYPYTGGKLLRRFYFRRGQEYRDNPLYRWHEDHLKQESHQFARYERYFPQEVKRRVPARALIHPEWRELKTGEYSEVEVKHGRLRRPLADGSLVYDPQFPSDSDEHAGMQSIATPPVAGSGDLTSVTATPLTTCASLVTFNPTQNSITVGINAAHRFHALPPSVPGALLRFLQRAAVLAARGDGKRPGSFSVEKSVHGSVVIVTGAPSSHCNAFCCGIDWAETVGGIVGARGAVAGTTASAPPITDGARGRVGGHRRKGLYDTTPSTADQPTLSGVHPLGRTVGWLRDAHVLAAFLAGVDTVEPNLVIVPVANGVVATSLGVHMLFSSPLRFVTPSVRVSLPDALFGLRPWSIVSKLLATAASKGRSTSLSVDERLAVVRGMCCVPGLTLLAGDLVDCGLLERSAVVAEGAAACIAAEVRNVIRCDGGSLRAAVAQGAAAASFSDDLPRALTPLRRSILVRVFGAKQADKSFVAQGVSSVDELVDLFDSAAEEGKEMGNKRKLKGWEVGEYATADDDLEAGHYDPIPGEEDGVGPLSGRQHGKKGFDGVVRVQDLFRWEQSDPWLKDFVEVLEENDLQARMSRVQKGAGETAASFAKLCSQAIRAAAPQAVMDSVKMVYPVQQNDADPFSLDPLSQLIDDDYNRALRPLLVPSRFTTAPKGKADSSDPVKDVVGDRDAVVGAARYDGWLRTLPASLRSSARNPVVKGRGRRATLAGMSLSKTAEAPFAPASVYHGNLGPDTKDVDWVLADLSASYEAFESHTAVAAMARAPVSMVSNFKTTGSQKPTGEAIVNLPPFSTRSQLAQQYPGILSDSTSDVTNVGVVRSKSFSTAAVGSAAAVGEGVGDGTSGLSSIRSGNVVQRLEGLFNLVSDHKEKCGAVVSQGHASSGPATLRVPAPARSDSGEARFGSMG